MTILESIKAELAELRKKFAAFAVEPKAEDEPKADEPKADAPKEEAPKEDAPKEDEAPKADEPKEEEPTAEELEETNAEVAEAFIRLQQIEDKASAIDIAAIKAELKTEVSAELEKTFEARVASAAAEKVAAQGTAPLVTGALSKEDKQALKGRALTIAAMKAEKSKA